MNVDGYEMTINARGPSRGIERLTISLGMGMAALAFVAAVGQDDEWERFTAFCLEQYPGAGNGVMLDRLRLIVDARVLGDASMEINASVEDARRAHERPAGPYGFELTGCTATDVYGGQSTPGIRLVDCTTDSSEEEES